MVATSDSGASQNFTNDINDFTEYEEIKNGQKVQTASKGNQLQVSVVGTVILTYKVVEKGKKLERMSHLFPVFYIYGLSIRLLSLGTLLNDGLKLRGTVH